MRPCSASYRNERVGVVQHQKVGVLAAPAVDFGVEGVGARWIGHLERGEAADPERRGVGHDERHTVAPNDGEQ